MKRKIFAAVVFLATIVSILNMAFFIKDAFFFGLTDLPEGEFMYSSMSPTSDKTVKIYRINSSLGTAIRGELITLDAQNNQTRENIFWCTDINNAITSWVDDNTVSINDIMLNTENGETFDSRRDLISDNPALKEKQSNLGY